MAQHFEWSVHLQALLRYRRLCVEQSQKAKNKIKARAERRISDLRHKATSLVIDFCQEHKVGSLFIDNPHGIRNRESG